MSLFTHASRSPAKSSVCLFDTKPQSPTHVDEPCSCAGTRRRSLIPFDSVGTCQQQGDADDDLSLSFGCAVKSLAGKSQLGSWDESPLQISLCGLTYVSVPVH